MHMSIQITQEDKGNLDSTIAETLSVIGVPVTQNEVEGVKENLRRSSSKLNLVARVRSLYAPPATDRE